MKNLTTQKFIFGVLVAFVLALGVQGTADAINKFTKTSSTDNQVVSINQPFTIRFSVGLQNNTTPIKNASEKLIKDSTELGAPFDPITDANHRISSSGYLVFDATDGNEYRTIPSGALTGLTLRVDPRPKYSAAGTATSPYYVERTNTNLVDSTGKAVYAQTGSGSGPFTYTRATGTPHASDTTVINGVTYRDTTANSGGTLVVDPRPEYTAAGDPASSTYYVGLRNTNVVDSAGNAVYIQTGGGTVASPWTYRRATANPNPIVPNVNRYHYNEESISITPSGVSAGSITFTKGSTSFERGDSVPLTLSEHAEESDERLSSSISLSCRADMAGVYTITIADATATADRPGDASTASDITFTVTVQQAINTARTGTLDGLSDTIVGAFGTTDLTATVTEASGGSAANVRVEFEITRGPGSLSATNTIGSSTSKRLSTVTDTTGGTATVTLDPKSGTNHVRAWIYGNSPGTTGKSTEGIYIYRYPVLKKVSGDSPDPQQNQKGPAGSRLEEPFVVQLFDSTERTKIPGATIAFAVLNTQGSLAKDPNFPSTLYSTDFSTSGNVTTDSDGKANVFLVLGDTATTQQGATATFTVGTTADIVTFNASIGTATSKASSITRVAGTDGQSANQYGQLEKPLTVVVRDQGGRRLAHTDDTSVIVTFVTLNGGELTAPTTSEPGSLSDESDALNTDRAIDVETDVNGEASVRYTAPEEGGRRTVRATINNGLRSVVFTINGTPTRDAGDDDGDGTRDPPTITRNLNISVSGSGNTRTVTVTALENGVSQTGISVTLTVSGAASLSGTSSGPTPLERTLTLPTTAGTYTLRASTTATGYSAVTEDVTITVPGTLSISTINPTTGPQQVTVTARRGGSLQSGVNFTISGSGIIPARSVTTTTGSGNAILTFPNIGTYALVVRADGYTDLPVNVTISTTATTTTTDTTTTDTTTTDTTTTDTTLTTAEPSSIQIGGQPTRSGTANTELDAPLLVRVLDDDGDAVPDARVTFRVRTGQGRLSQRGNGRAVAVQTDASGFARANYTPISASSTVEAEVRGVTTKVTFTITTGSAPLTAGAGTAGTAGTARQYKVGEKIPVSLNDTLTFTGSRTVSGTTYTCVGPGECVISHGLLVKGEIRAATVPKVQAKAYKVGEKIPVSLNDTLSFTNSHTVQGTTYTCISQGECVISYGLVTKGEIRIAASKSGTTVTDRSPVISAAATSHPPMLWIEEGSIYTLVGSNFQRFASVTNATSLAMSRDKLYWTAKTSETHGTLNSANLNGTDVKVIRDLFGVPLNIAVTGDTLYWTDALGRVQRSNLDGSGIENVVRGLTNPGDIAIAANGRVYWSEAAGSLRYTNISGTPRVNRIIATGLGEPLSIAIGGGKIYWLERAMDSSGKLQRANLDGANVELLKTFPVLYDTSIAIDGQKLYLTGTGGKITRRNLNGLGYEEVARGLSNPGSLVLGGATTAVAVTTPTTTTTTTTTTTDTDNSKYDVNGDSVVNKADRDAIAVAIVANSTDAKFDVNGDGAVDVLDVLAVVDNIPAGAAGAPTPLGMKLSLAEVDRLQEQVNLLIATDDRSPAAMRTLIYLQQLIATARPEKTQLLANYPNPFNPETWIPYELATDTDVRLTIYNAQGVVIRTLQLGQQSAGYYTDRERAAYWDGRNALGEQVASGIYFYQLETDTMSLMRKMVILK